METSKTQDQKREVGCTIAMVLGWFNDVSPSVIFTEPQENDIFNLNVFLHI
jgi:hypothetical protein